MINNNSNIINKNNKQKPQMINIDLQGEFLMRNKIKIKNGVKKHRFFRFLPKNEVIIQKTFLFLPRIIYHNH